MQSCLHFISRNLDINTYRVHVNDNTSTINQSGISLLRILNSLDQIIWFLFQCQMFTYTAMKNGSYRDLI